MKPKSQSDRTQLQLFQAHFDLILTPDHPLIILADKIDWTRLLVGLHYLKHAFDESDESVLERWVENSYWQQF